MKYQKSNAKNKNFFYHFARCIIHPILDVLSHLEVYGNENIPRHGAVLLVSNHSNVTHRDGIP